MIGFDVTPLLLERRRGVARALQLLLDGLAMIERPVPAVLLAPRAPTTADGLPGLDGVHIAAASSARRFRRLLPHLARDAGVTTFVSPWLAAPRMSMPTAVWVHELPFVRHGPIEGRARAARQRAWLRRHVRRGATFVVPSESTGEDLRSLHPTSAARIHVVPNAFDPAPWRAAARAPVDTPYAVVVGTGRGAAGARKKGIDRIAAIEPRLQGIAVRVLGDDHVDDAELRQVVAGARVLVCPSRSEGFGYTPLEAMAAGVPVVATRAGAIPEVTGGAALLVDAHDDAALADAVQRAAFDDGVRAPLIAKGQARVDAYPPAAIARLWMERLAPVGAGT